MVSLKVFRLLRGKTQFELSLETEIPSYRLSVLENERAEPSANELSRLAQALGVFPEQLREQITEKLLCR